MPPLDRLHAFIQTRLRHPDTRTVNLLNSSLGAWLRYYGCLQEIRRRYEEANVPYMEAVQRELDAVKKDTVEPGQPVSREVTQQEWQEMQRTTDLGVKLHLEIESFHVFANILLDRIASTFRYYFWWKSDWNHWQLTTNLENICKKKSLVVPSHELLRLPGQLQDKIVSYRNKRVEHVEEPRVQFATSWGPDRKTKIMPTFLYPTAEEAEEHQKPTEDLDEILALLNAYIVAVLDFFDTNGDKSILPPNP